jgi:hypothetical protein
MAGPCAGYLSRAAERHQAEAVGHSETQDALVVLVPAVRHDDPISSSVVFLVIHGVLARWHR